jgi:hypothetical protein
MTRRITLCTLLFCLLALLVNAHAFDSLNHFAHRHLQPIAGGHGHRHLREFTEILLLPAAPVVAAILMGVLSVLFYRRGRISSAIIWPAVLAVGFAVELLAKLVVSQDHSNAWGLLGLSLDSSYPSGHMLRAILLIFAATSLWPRFSSLVIVVFCGVGFMLLVNGWHTPTDIVGGMLIGLALGWFASEYEAADGFGHRSVPAGYPRPLIERTPERVR